jgi:hypothetical protein
VNVAVNATVSTAPQSVGVSAAFIGALRSSAEHDAFKKMVLAQGVGHADRQAPRDEEGDRGARAPAGRDHAPHLG